MLVARSCKAVLRPAVEGWLRSETGHNGRWVVASVGDRPQWEVGGGFGRRPATAGGGWWLRSETGHNKQRPATTNRDRPQRVQNSHD